MAGKLAKTRGAPVTAPVDDVVGRGGFPAAGMVTVPYAAMTEAAPERRGAGGSGSTLSEAASKDLLGRYGVPFAEERIAATADEAAAAADALGYPVVAKLNGDAIAHKTERGLVRLGLRDADAVRAAAAELLAAATPEDGPVQVLVAPMLRGTRELIAGLSEDPQFGTTVMVGVGGILAEAVADVSIRLVPIEPVDAEDMIDDLATQPLLGPFRGEPAVDRQALVDVLVGLSRAATEDRRIRSADLNPLIVVDGRPIAVDALVEVR
jgi:succinyl-CoA synthetase beta subunit